MLNKIKWPRNYEQNSQQQQKMKGQQITQFILFYTCHLGLERKILFERFLSEIKSLHQHQYFIRSILKLNLW